MKSGLVLCGVREVASVEVKDAEVPTESTSVRGLRKVFECGDTIREGPSPARGNFETEERDGWGAWDTFPDVDDNAVRREAFKEDFLIFRCLRCCSGEELATRTSSTYAKQKSSPWRAPSMKRWKVCPALRSPKVMYGNWNIRKVL